MATILLTGFPGFLGSALLERVLDRDPDATAVCLVQSKFAGLAKQRVDALVAAAAGRDGRIRLVEGDITESGLGLSEDPAEEITEIHHLAAVYDLSVARDVGMRINVDGTRNVLEFAKRCPKLERLQYVSTCYVAGSYPGRFAETDLEKGQEFNNFYEETKYLAEVDVQAAMREGLPATIYRPSIVVGDSRTGATQKYDGPYFVMQWLMRQRGLAVLPTVGNTHRHRLNVVPRDFVIDALAHLTGLQDNAGVVYQLADPAPLTINGLVDEMAEAVGRRVVRVRLPLGLAKASIDKVPGVFKLLRIPSASIDYFVEPTTFDTTNATAALEPAGIHCPSFPSYVGALVEYMRAHRDVSSAAMI